MPRSLTVSLLVLALPVPGICASVWSPNGFFRQATEAVKKPSPRPSPKPGQPNPTDPGAAKVNNIDPTRANRTATGEATGATTGTKPDTPEDTQRAREGRKRALADFEGGKNTRVSYPRGFMRVVRRPGTSNTCDPTKHEVQDLTGTYSGQINFPSRKLSGPATLTIEGRKFNLVSENLVLSGNLASETTCDYTAVAIRLETVSPAESAENSAETISLRAQRAGSNLALVSVEGETQFEFAPVSRAMRRRRH